MHKKSARGTRTHRFNMLMKKSEYDMLKTLASADGISSADYVRQFVRRAFREREAVPR